MQKKITEILIRFFDISLSVLGLVALTPLAFIIYVTLLAKLKKPFFTQKRMGQFKEPFTIIKFRTMHSETPSLPTHKINKKHTTKFGLFLRKYKLDEIPQLINVLLGDMSLVGPRPNLFNQKDLIKERDKRKVYYFLPGITGLSQINNIDMSTPKLLSITDEKMLKSMNLKNYFYYIFITLTGKGRGDAIK